MSDTQKPANPPRVTVTFGGPDVETVPEDGKALCLYGLVRNDMDSMNKGMSVAQGMHAANKMAWMARRSGDPSLLAMLEAWEGQSKYGFGVAVTLEVNERMMRRAVEEARAVGLLADVVRDDSYPLRDGQVVHVIQVDTCAFVFGPNFLARAALGKLGLLGDERKV